MSAPYSERAYFHGEPCRHVAAYHDHQRLKRIDRRAEIEAQFAMKEGRCG